ncbi:hypothetical protein NKI79_26695 [Mesorhizobium sp. M0340]|uniref:hypothetical protein n=1 Tax=Mesorhizobium sp. M0340 TaxID=2956939 RepID=UPI00333AD541
MLDFTGTWQNQREAKLELRKLGGGIIDGRFESGVGDDNKTHRVEINVRSLRCNHVPCGIRKVRIHRFLGWAPDWLWYSKRIGPDVFRTLWRGVASANARAL